MSGNKYEDILEHLEKKDREKVKKILHLMSSFHPVINYDRAFQRELKGKLLKNKQQSRWYFFLPKLSIVATSFLVLIGMWKMWGDTLLLKQVVPTHVGVEVSNRMSIGESQMENIPTTDIVGSALTAREQTTDGELTVPFSAQGERSEPAFAKNAKNTANTFAEKSSLPKNVKGNEVDLSDEIASISSDIDAIMESSTPPDAPTETPVAALMMTKMSTFSDPLPQTSQSNTITIEYPGRMAIYKKSDTSWTEIEVTQRNAPGMIKSIEKTLTKVELIALLSDKNVVEGSVIEYRRAKKDGENAYFLIPCLRYINIFGDVSFASLVPGYILD